MHLNCPHCHNAMHVDSDVELSNVVCEACGSHFSLLGDVDPMDTLSTIADGSDVSRKMIDRFELINEVGRGAFGSVWRAVDTHLHRDVAIKIPRKGKLNQRESEQFFREARAVAQLNHPNIVSVHEIGKDDDRIYIVSDFVHGVSLADRLTAGQPNMRQSATICVKVATALHHAHQQGVIHRDLKPSNIMLNADGEPFVMDFGLAKRDAGEITLTMDGQLLGTPAYMSPEQATGKAHDVDGKSDVYSMGVILFELLTGELPFRGNARMLLHQVINDEAPSPLKLNSNVPRDLATIALKCLSKDPPNRYETAENLCDDLQRFLDGKPISARPAGQFERAIRWCKRNVAMASMLAIVTLLVSALAVAGPIVAFRESSLRKQSQAQTAAAETARNEAEKQKSIASAAQQASDAERLRAEREKRVAVTVRSFLQTNLLSQASIYEQANDGSNTSVKRDLTLIEAVEKAAEQFSPEQIENKFPGQPSVQAEILETIAAAFTSFDRHDSAIKFSKAAIEIHQASATSPCPPELLRSRVNYIFVLMNAQDHVQAAREYSLALRLTSKALNLRIEDFKTNDDIDIEHEIDLRVDAVFDTISKRLDPKEFALPVFSLGEDLSFLEITQISTVMLPTFATARNIHDRLADRYGPKDLRTNYAELYLGFQHHAVAEIKSLTGIDLNGIVTEDFASFDKAIRSYETALNGMTVHLGENDTRLAGVQIILGVTHIRLGNSGYKEIAFEYFDAASKILQQQVADTHPAFAMVAELKAEVLVRMDRFKEAAKELEVSVLASRQMYGNQDVRTMVAISNLGLTHQDICLQTSDQFEYEEHFELAKKSLLESYELSKLEYGLDSKRTAAAANQVGVFLIRRGDYRDAESYFQEAWDYRGKHVGRSNSMQYLLTLSMYCHCLESNEKSDIALPLMEELANLRGKFANDNQPLIRSDHLRLARIYRELGKDDQSQSTLEKIDENSTDDTFSVSFNNDTAGSTELGLIGWIVSDIDVTDGKEHNLNLRMQESPQATRSRIFRKIKSSEFEALKKRMGAFQFVKSVNYESEGQKFIAALWQCPIPDFAWVHRDELQKNPLHDVDSKQAPASK